MVALARALGNVWVITARVGFVRVFLRVSSVVCMLIVTSSFTVRVQINGLTLTRVLSWRQTVRCVTKLINVRWGNTVGSVVKRIRNQPKKLAWISTVKTMANFLVGVRTTSVNRLMMTTSSMDSSVSRESRFLWALMRLSVRPPTTLNSRMKRLIVHTSATQQIMRSFASWLSILQITNLVCKLSNHQ